MIEKSDERVFLPGRKNPVVLRQNSAPLLLLAAIRDEAHRFAIEYHRSVRGKEGIASEIEQIPGIGAKRRTALLRHFGSLQRLKEASVEEIAGTEGINRATAERLHVALHGEKASEPEINMVERRTGKHSHIDSYCRKLRPTPSYCCSKEISSSNSLLSFPWVRFDHAAWLQQTISGGNNP